MKICRILVFLGFFQITAFSEADDRTAEAERFYREAVLLHKHDSFAQAAEKAEAAYSLVPENKQFKETLALFLDEYARSLLISNTKSRGGIAHLIAATPDGARQSLELVHRAFDLVEKDPNYFNSVYIGPSTNWAHGFFLEYYLELIPLVPPEIYPEWKTDAKKFQDRIFSDWTEFRYHERCKQVVDKKTFGYWRGIAWPHNYILKSAPKDTVAQCFERYFADLLNFAKKFDVPPRNIISRYEYEKYALFVAPILRAADKAGHDGVEFDRARKTIHRTLDFLTEQDSLYLETIAWMIRFEATRNGDDEKRIRDKIDSIPHSHDFGEYVCLFEKLYAMSSDPDIFGRRIKLFDYALARGVFYYKPLMELFDEHPLSHDQLQALADAYRRGLGALKNGDASFGTGVDYHRGLPENAEMDYRSLLERLEPTPTAVVWKEKIVLISDPEKPSVLDDHPGIALHENTLCVLSVETRIESAGRYTIIVKPVLIDLRTLRKTDLAKHIIPFVGRSLQSNFTENWRTAALDEKNVYVGTRDYGILIFPRDGGSVRVIDTSHELPDNFIQGIAVMDGKLYASTGDPMKRTRLVVIDLTGDRIETIANSIGKTGLAPLTDVSFPFSIVRMTVDTRRQRLLFRVATTSAQDIEGVWALDGKTGSLEQIAAFTSLPNWHNIGIDAGDKSLTILPDGDKLFVQDRRQFYLVDLDDHSRTHLITSPWVIDLNRVFGDYSSYRSKYDATIRRTVARATMQDGKIWGLVESEFRNWFWARIDPENPDQLEKLVPCDEFGGNRPSIREILSTPDGKASSCTTAILFFIIDFDPNLESKP